MAVERPRTGVSSCLLGEHVRYDGGHKRDVYLTGTLTPHVDWVPVCPEMELGLGAPRETLHLVGTPDAARLVTTRTAVDHTPAFAAYAERRIAELSDARLDGYVLKTRSPSCGPSGVPRFAPRAAGERPSGDIRGYGAGLFAERLTAALPGLPVLDERRLTDATLREHFVERLFARARLRALFESDWRPRDLVAFHTRQRFQLLAHDPEREREAGRIVARTEGADPCRLRTQYTEVFDLALARPAGAPRHLNTLRHLADMLGDRLDDARRRDLLGVLEEFRRGEVALHEARAALAREARLADHADVAAQSYLAPYPAGVLG